MLYDDLIARQVQLFRLTAGERAKVYRILRTMEDELVELLAFSGKKLSDITRADKARLLRQAQALIEAYFGNVADAVGETLGDLGGLEATATAASLGAVYAGKVEPNMPPVAFLARLVDDTLIEGAVSRDWWKRQSGDLAFRFKSAVAQGLAAGETNDQIIRRIRGRAQGFDMVDGKRVYRYVGGVMDIARHHAAAQVQTSIQAVANASRMATFEANEDIIKGYRQLSTLDGHTTPQCIAYSGAEWDLQKRPINGNTLPFVSPKGSINGTPRHWNCRSLIVPITKTFRELGFDMDDFAPSTRAASGGPVAANETFDTYLKRREAAKPGFADGLLGPGKADLWRKKKITLTQLLDQSGRPLTLKQLRELYDA